MSLDPLYRVIGWLLAVFYVPTHSLGIATILLTVVIMLVQFPLTAKQARSMIQMQRVQPEIKKIQQKYKDDKAKQNEELLKFYQENKINPLAGCLPMIITIPIGIAVFRTFSKGVQHHLPTSGGVGKLYQDICGHAATTKACGTALAKHTPSAMHFLGVNLNSTARDASGAGAIPYYVLIALVAATGWYQVKQTQARQLQSGNTPPNAQMQAMTKIFPVFFAFICLGLNAGATLYFVVSNVWRIGQQHLVINKLYDQAVTAGDLKPKDGSAAKDKEDPKRATPDDETATNGKAKPGTAPGPKGQTPSKPDAKGTNGSNGKGQGMSSGRAPQETETLTVEWIEVSGKTLEDAKELALDRLGVIADELEFEVIDEPRSGLFGIGRTDARIRARVKPLSREKPADRRRRRTSERRPSGGNRKPRGEGSGGRGGGASSRPAAAEGDEADTSERPAGAQGSASSRSRRRRGGRAGGSGAGNGGGGAAAGRSNEQTRSQGNDDRPEAKVNVETDADDVDVEGQAVRAAEFTRTLVDAMGLSGTVSSRVDDDTVLVAVEGDGLGLLVGPRGSTLQAIEELVRAVVQHGLSGRSARLRVDVGGYKERRREALAAFARQVADEVRESNLERALEPMSPPDRKVVHDTVADIEGVSTSSEGEEPRRRVVISPA